MDLTPPKPAVRRRMERQKRSDTAPEVELRRALFRLGKRYRCGYPVPGFPRRTIDIAFPGLRLAVFVDGCFWHACPEHYVPPKANAAWWARKIGSNVQRDSVTTLALEERGWTVLRLWEHTPIPVAVRTVLSALGDP